MADEVTDYGFKWGPMDVLRTASIRHKGRLYYTLMVVTDGVTVDLTFSEHGHNVRIRVDGKELS